MRGNIFALGLIALTSAPGVFAQVASQTSTTSSTTGPVAYVYVSRPTHIDGFAASTNGALTPVPGSPFANTSVVKMSVTKKFLLGIKGDGSAITSYAIASNGSIKKISSVDPYKYEGYSGCATYPEIQVDFAKSTVYDQENPNCTTGIGAYLSFHIESNGDLQYLGSSGGYIDGATQGAMVRLNFIGSDLYAYDTYCAEDESDQSVIDIYKRESNGMLQYTGQDNQAPLGPPGTAGYCAGTNASDQNHLAVAEQRIDSQDGDDGFITGPYFLASYTADANGNLTTTSTYENMPETGASNQIELDAISVAPTHDLLAVGGPEGFQIFHFNGGSPITKYSSVLQAGVKFTKFGWDKHNHLYALGGSTAFSNEGTKLYVYTVTTTSIKQAPGSPYTIPEASNVIVLDLQ
ncbi:MAG TPA: hypothetical protein VGJ21_12105 [Terracidiphilus sp.]|jgi:hypothetical protein